MKRPWIWALLVGLLLGAAAGLVLSPWVFAPPSAEVSTLFRDFAFPQITQKADPSNWEILEDRIAIYPPSLVLGRPQHIERRISARASLSKTEFLAFAQQFESVMEDALRSTEEAVEFNPPSLANRGGVKARLEPQVPRYYQHTTYQIGDRFGVLEALLNCAAGEATAIVRLTESYEPSALPPAPSGTVNWKRR